VYRLDNAEIGICQSCVKKKQIAFSRWTAFALFIIIGLTFVCLEYMESFHPRFSKNLPQFHDMIWLIACLYIVLIWQFVYKGDIIGKRLAKKVVQLGKTAP